MSSTTAVCPRCFAEVSSDMARCQACKQVLKRPAATVAASVPSVAEPSSSPVKTVGVTISTSVTQVEVPPAKLESETATGTIDRGTPCPPSSEKLRVTCACGVGIRVSIALRGKRVKCPKCSAVVLVPISQDSAASGGSEIVPAIERLSSVQSPNRSSSSSGDSSVVRRSAESAVMNRSADDQTLKQEIESAAKRPVPADAVPLPEGKLSFLKLRKIRKQLETANVLSDADTVARRQSLLELGQSQDRQVLEILVEHAQDNLSVIRDGAITGLGELGDPAAVPTVLRALLDRDADVLRAAFAALKKVGDCRVVRPLLRYGIERPQWKPLANDTLVRLGPRAMQELLSLLHSNDAGLMLDAIVVLGRIGDKQAVPSLAACLSHVSNLLKAHVTEALALIGDPSSVPQLLQMLQDSCAAVRANAASGLVRLVDQRSFRPLLNALQDEDAHVRRYAAIALGELGETKAVPNLLKVLQGWDLLIAMDAPFVEAIVESVGKLGDASAASGLLPLLQSQHEGVMFKTVLALKKLKSPSAIPALTSLLHAPQPALRRRVVETLGNTGDAMLVPVIGEVLRQDASREVRATAARSLGELKSREACPFLEEALREEFSIRCQAVIALGTIQEKSTLPALMAMLKDGAPEVRYHAINAIAKFKDPKTLKAMAVMLEDADPMVRSGATKVIEEIDGASENRSVKEVVRRVRSRDLMGRLIPKFVFLVLPQTKTMLSVVAGVLAASLLMVFVINTSIGNSKPIVLRGFVSSLAISADGNSLVAVRTRGLLEVWDIERGRVAAQVPAKMTSSLLSRPKDGVVLISDAMIIPWNLTGEPDSATGWREHKSPIVASCSTPDAKLAATLDKDLNAVIWDLGTGQKRGTVKLDKRIAATMTISPEGQWLATSSPVGEIALWDVESGQLIKEFSRGKAQRAFSHLAISPDSKWLVGAGQNSGLRVWDLEALADGPASKSKSKSKEQTKSVDLEGTVFAVALRFLSDSKRVLTASVSGEIRIWDIDSGKSRAICTGDLEQTDALAVSTDEKRFAIGGKENSAVFVYDLESGKLLKKLDVR